MNATLLFVTIISASALVLAFLAVLLARKWAIEANNRLDRHRDKLARDYELLTHQLELNKITAQRLEYLETPPIADRITNDAMAIWEAVNQEKK